MVTTERLEEMHRIHASNRDLLGYLPEKVRDMNRDVCDALAELLEFRLSFEAAAKRGVEQAVKQEMAARREVVISGEMMERAIFGEAPELPPFVPGVLGVARD